jgi:hypothetical protein
MGKNNGITITKYIINNTNTATQLEKNAILPLISLISDKIAKIHDSTNHTSGLTENIRLLSEGNERFCSWNMVRKPGIIRNKTMPEVI